MHSYVLVVGSVTADQYAIVREDLRRKDQKPHIARLTEEEWTLQNSYHADLRRLYANIRVVDRFILQVIEDCWVPLVKGSKYRIPAIALLTHPMVTATIEALLREYFLADGSTIGAVVMPEEIWSLRETNYWLKCVPGSANIWVVRPDGQTELRWS